jgi:hypothetical protein
MNNEQKVGYIKYWLQKFGNRDNQTFNTEVIHNEITWSISLQYNFDNNGDQIDPFNWCVKSFKHVFDTDISDRTEDELDGIIYQLKSKKTHY